MPFPNSSRFRTQVSLLAIDLRNQIVDSNPIFFQDRSQNASHMLATSSSDRTGLSDGRDGYWLSCRRSDDATNRLCVGFNSCSFKTTDFICSVILLRAFGSKVGRIRQIPGKRLLNINGLTGCGGGHEWVSQSYS
jgi:hypothetical protein